MLMMKNEIWRANEMECAYCGDDFEETGACLVYKDEYYCDEECLYNAIVEDAEWMQLDGLED